MNDLFLRAARGEKTERIAVWLMRQAGRSLPGYRKLREKYGVLELAQTPELAAEVSQEPVKLLGVDAAILFADIMLLPLALGVPLKIVDSIGPVIDSPIESEDDIKKLLPFKKNNVAYLGETIRILRDRLDVPVIGFSGAPFTLASYLIEGRPTRNWSKTKRFMLEKPALWDLLMRKLSDAVIEYLGTQIQAGAQAVQIFDSWVGSLSPADYRTHVLPHTQRIFSSLKDRGVPRIHFGTDTGAMLDDFADVDCEVIGVDWRIELSRAREIIGKKSLQGNLDPAVLLCDWEVVEKKIDAMLEDLGSRKGYIFNLGHGVMPETDDRQVKRLVEYVHAQ
jgi:uroporphyrinogen decarboxylase